MTTAHEALRQCMKVLKLVDFKDCAESDELWHKFNLAQANAERVLRDGEKQELSNPDALRAAGRAEAMAIIMQLDPESGIDDYTGWSKSGAPEDEGGAFWKEDKLRELFVVDGLLPDMMDKAEAEYWHYKGLQMEAEHAKNFAANMHNSGKVREVLAKAGEYDLMADLCRDHAPSLQAVGAVPRITQEQIDYIGEQWDGCMYDAPGMMIDIGQSIRAELAKLNTAPQPAAAPSGDVERDAGLDALKALVDYLADSDEEGLIEHAEPMVAARKALADYNPIAQCTNSDSWNCKYCRVVDCAALKDPRNFGKSVAAITATKE